jgi:shikimate kinase
LAHRHPSWDGLHGLTHFETMWSTARMQIAGVPSVEPADAEAVADAPRILLVGMMGSGKTTIGLLLSERTGWRYVDNDELLARQFKLTPREILGNRGEADLRTMESQALTLGLAESPPCIVGVAAGTILDEGDRSRLRDGGTVVWLHGTAETLTRRAAGSRHRAWLEEGGKAWIRAALHEREPLYLAVADLIVSVDNRTPKEVVDEIVDGLRPKAADGLA